ncbi:MAG: DUF4265 domain-containing protein [Steroidobacteraceae bacterium]
MAATTPDRVKIAFRLIRDADDYPPADWEHLWAIPRGADHFELDNIPFFAKGVAAGDLVAAQRDDNQLVFERVIQPGGHSTVRVIMFDPDQKAVIRGELEQLGCETEGSHLPNLFAVDVPPEAAYTGVMKLLADKAGKDVLDYEEAAVRH